MRKTWWTNKLSFARSPRGEGDEEFSDMKNKQHKGMGKIDEDNWVDEE